MLSRQVVSREPERPEPEVEIGVISAEVASDSRACMRYPGRPRTVSPEEANMEEVAGED